MIQLTQSAIDKIMIEIAAKPREVKLSEMRDMFRVAFTGVTIPAAFMEIVPTMMTMINESTPDVVVPESYIDHVYHTLQREIRPGKWDGVIENGQLIVQETQEVELEKFSKVLSPILPPDRIAAQALITKMWFEVILELNAN